MSWQEVTVGSQRVTIENRYLDGQPQIALGALFMLKLIAGGFLSVDGMHPSGCGYAVFASARQPTEASAETL
jgi:hypothetical protein